MINLLFGGISLFGLLRVVILKLLDDYNLSSEPVIHYWQIQTQFLGITLLPPQSKTNKTRKKVTNCNFLKEVNCQSSCTPVPLYSVKSVLEGFLYLGKHFIYMLIQSNSCIPKDINSKLDFLKINVMKIQLVCLDLLPWGKKKKTNTSVLLSIQMRLSKSLQTTWWRLFGLHLPQQATCLSPSLWHFTGARNTSQVGDHVWHVVFASSWLPVILKVNNVRFQFCCSLNYHTVEGKTDSTAFIVLNLCSVTSKRKHKTKPLTCSTAGSPFPVFKHNVLRSLNWAGVTVARQPQCA